MIFEELTPASALNEPAPMLPLVDGSQPYGVMRKRQGDSDVLAVSSTVTVLTGAVWASATTGKRRRSRSLIIEVDVVAY